MCIQFFAWDFNKMPREFWFKYCSKRRREGASEHVALCGFEERNVTLRTRKMTHHARDVIFTIDPVRKEFLLLNLSEIHQSWGAVETLESGINVFLEHPSITLHFIAQTTTLNLISLNKNIQIGIYVFFHKKHFIFNIILWDIFIKNFQGSLIERKCVRVI